MSEASEKVIAVCYCRVSTGSEEQLSSFKNQRLYFEEFAEKNSDKIELYKCENNEWTGIYADRGVSGTLLHRESFEKMLWDAGLDCKFESYQVKRIVDETIDKKYISVNKNEQYIEYRDYTIRFNENAQKPKFTEIFVKDTARFARNIMVTDILRKLSHNGVYVTFLDINRSTRNKDDIFVIQMLQQFDEQFSQDLSRKLLHANEQSAKKQILRSNPDLYGYDYIPRKASKDNNNHLIAIENEAYVIQMIFRLYLGCFKPDIKHPKKMQPCNFKCSECDIYKKLSITDGLGRRLILRVINDIYKFRTRSGKPFEESTLQHIMEQEKYTAHLNNRKWDHGTLFAKNATPKIREVELVHKPELIDEIISKELFDLCRNKKVVKAGDSLGVNIGRPTRYKGKIYCSVCGNRYVHNWSNKYKEPKGFYTCHTKRKKGKEECQSVPVYDEQLNEYIAYLCNGGLNEIINKDNKWLLGTIYSKLAVIFNDITKTDSETVSIARTELKSKTEKLINLINRASSSKVLEEVLEDSIKQLTEEVSILKTRLNELVTPPSEFLARASKLITIFREVVKLIENQKDKYDENELWEIVSKLEVYGHLKKGGRASIVNLKPIFAVDMSAKSQLGISDEVTSINLTKSGVDVSSFYKMTTAELNKKIEDAENKLNSLAKEYM